MLKQCIIKRKLQFEDCKNCLKVTELENKINQLVKNKVNIDSFKKDHKEFINNNKLILKSQQRFRREKHNVFTEKVTRNDDKKYNQLFQ